LGWAYPHSVGLVSVTWDSLGYPGQPWALVTWAKLPRPILVIWAEVPTCSMLVLSKISKYLGVLLLSWYGF